MGFYMGCVWVWSGGNVYFWAGAGSFANRELRTGWALKWHFQKRFWPCRITTNKPDNIHTILTISILYSTGVYTGGKLE